MPVATLLRDPRCVGEHDDTAVVQVIGDDVRCAAQALRYALRTGNLTGLDRHAHELLAALDDAPETEIASCPGDLLEVERGWWNGQQTSTVRCTVCGFQESS